MKAIKTIGVKALVHILLAVSSLVCLGSRCTAESEWEIQGPVQTTTSQGADSVPLIVMGSYLNPTEDISLAEIKAGLEDRRILCTKDILPALVERFGLHASPAAIALERFDHGDDAKLVIAPLDSADHRFLAVRCNGADLFTEPGKYPLKVKGVMRSEGKAISYVHTGVTALTRQTGVLLDRIPVDDYLSDVIPYFKDADLVHISNEVSIKDSCDYRAMKYRFATKKSHFVALDRLGADIIELTGNHNLDFGPEPYLATWDWYQGRGMRAFGGGRNPEEANKPLVMNMPDGHKAAWVGYNQACPLSECADKGPGANRYEDAKARSQIESLRRDTSIRYILACVQFTESDSYSPTQRQRQIAESLIDWGADVVLGSQAHQAQEIAIHRRGMIFYGLGNFMFDQIHRIGVRQAFFLQAYFLQGRIVQFRPVYTFMNDQRRPSIANREQRMEIRRNILKPANFNRNVSRADESRSSSTPATANESHRH